MNIGVYKFIIIIDYGVLEGYIIEYYDKLKESVLNQSDLYSFYRKEYHRLLNQNEAINLKNRNLVDENRALSLKNRNLVDENGALSLKNKDLVNKNNVLLDELKNIKMEVHNEKSKSLSIQEDILNILLELRDCTEKNNKLINTNHLSILNKLKYVDSHRLNLDNPLKSMESSFFSRLDSLEIRQLDIHNLLLYLNDNYFNEINFDNSQKKVNDSISDKNGDLVSNSKDKLISMQDKVFSINDVQNKSLELIFSELKYGLLFENSIKSSKWLRNKNFSLINSDSNFSFMYILYQILDKIKPENILEFSLGQTTKLTTQYVTSNKRSKLTVIDSNQDWIDIFSNSLTLSDNVHIAFCDLELFKFKSTENYRYKNILGIVEDTKFDLIIINGPQGFLSASDVLMKYPKIDVLNLIDDNLNDDFIIIMDNYNRHGEKNTIKELKKLLNEKNLRFYTYEVLGLTEQCVICTENNKFINELFKQ